MSIRVLGSAGPYLDDRDTPGMDDWREVEGALERTYELGSFEEAIAFVNRVAGARRGGEPPSRHRDRLPQGDAPVDDALRRRNHRS